MVTHTMMPEIHHHRHHHHYYYYYYYYYYYSQKPRIQKSMPMVTHTMMPEIHRISTIHIMHSKMAIPNPLQKTT